MYCRVSPGRRCRNVAADSQLHPRRSASQTQAESWEATVKGAQASELGNVPKHRVRTGFHPPVPLLPFL